LNKEIKTSRYFDNLPKLNKDDHLHLDKPIMDEEILEVLNTCEESAPGPDGLSYDIYKHLWIHIKKKC